MIKIKTTLGDKRVLLLGLSHANLDRLKAQGLTGFIRVADPELELPVEIWITAAETEQVMIDAFKDGIRDGTKVRMDPRLKQ